MLRSRSRWGMLGLGCLALVPVWSAAAEPAMLDDDADYALVSAVQLDQPPAELTIVPTSAIACGSTNAAIGPSCAAPAATPCAPACTVFAPSCACPSMSFAMAALPAQLAVQAMQPALVPAQPPQVPAQTAARTMQTMTMTSQQRPAVRTVSNSSSSLSSITDRLPDLEWDDYVTPRYTAPSRPNMNAMPGLPTGSGWGRTRSAVTIGLAEAGLDVRRPFTTAARMTIPYYPLMEAGYRTSRAMFR